VNSVFNALGVPTLPPLPPLLPEFVIGGGVGSLSLVIIFCRTLSFAASNEGFPALTRFNISVVDADNPGKSGVTPLWAVNPGVCVQAGGLIDEFGVIEEICEGGG
jgi:hypothetical protein